MVCRMEAKYSFSRWYRRLSFAGLEFIGISSDGEASDLSAGESVSGEIFAAVAPKRKVTMGLATDRHCLDRVNAISQVVRRPQRGTGTDGPK